MKRLVALTLVLATLVSPVSEAATSAERTGYKLVNRERRERAIDTLVWRNRMSRIARRHSRRMADEDRIFHSRRLGSHFGDHWNALGENVGVGRTVRSLHGAFMDSPAHRDNVLCRCFDHIGIGIVRARGRVWITALLKGVP